jgi:hypothetical protein
MSSRTMLLFIMFTSFVIFAGCKEKEYKEIKLQATEQKSKETKATEHGIDVLKGSKYIYFDFLDLPEGVICVNQMEVDQFKIDGSIYNLQDLITFLQKKDNQYFQHGILFHTPFKEMGPSDLSSEKLKELCMERNIDFYENVPVSNRYVKKTIRMVVKSTQFWDIK